MDIRRRTILRSATLGAVLTGCSAPGQTPAVTSKTASPPETAEPTSRASAGATSTAASPTSGASAPIRNRGPAAEIGHGPRTVAAVALTFHGAGPLPLARSILSEVTRGGGAATVLAVGTWLDADLTAARLVLDGGHELGNHTMNHLPMRGLSPTTALREIAGCARILKQQTGTQGTWFRPSGTPHTTTAIRRAAGAAGYHTCVSYDLDSMDWQDPPPATVIGNVLGPVRNGSIISLHLGHAGTVKAIPAILDGLRTKGLRPVTLTELLMP